VVFAAVNPVRKDSNGECDILVYQRWRGRAVHSRGTDLNRNGQTDLVGRNTSSVVVALWFRNRMAIASSGFPAGVSLSWKIAQVGDVDADGKADVMWRHSTSSTVAVWLMDRLSISSVGFPGSASTAWEIQ